MRVRSAITGARNPVLEGSVTAGLPRWRQSELWIGLTLLTHFAVVCAVKLAGGRGDEIWWMSHVALMISGVGFVARSPLLLTTALTNILIPHLVWLSDFGVWLCSGGFPLQVCSYLADGDVWTWIATLHHFYLTPLLVASFIRRRQCPMESFPAAVAVFLYLTVISRGVLSPTCNVNYAFSLLPGVDLPLLNHLNRLPGVLYLLALNALSSGLLFLPTVLLLRGAARHSAAVSSARAEQTTLSRSSIDRFVSHNLPDQIA